MNGPFRRDETQILKKNEKGVAKRTSSFQKRDKNINFDMIFTGCHLSFWQSRLGDMQIL
jgi:hypothetical protein